MLYTCLTYPNSITANVKVMVYFTFVVLVDILQIVVLFNNFRFIILRRFLSLGGTLYLLRAVCMLITSLSVPCRYFECQRHVSITIAVFPERDGEGREREREGGRAREMARVGRERQDEREGRERKQEEERAGGRTRGREELRGKESS